MKKATPLTWLYQKSLMLMFLLAGALVMNSASASVNNNTRQEINFNHNWKFKSGDHTAYKDKQHNDSGWTVLDVPHDYIFEEGVSKDGSQKQFGGNHGGGLAWYRKHFAFDPNWQGKQVFIQFDGVYMNSEVWLNGQLLGNRPYGYISFQYDITEHLNRDSNVISVRVDNELQPSARWYHPGGIYAPVRLVVVDPTHIKHNSLFIHTPIVGDKTTVQTEFELSKDVKRAADYDVRYRVFDQEGAQVLTGKSTLNKLKQQDKFQFSFELTNAKRWNPHAAYLYNLNLEILHKGKVIDSDNSNFGVRDIAWRTDTGFWINGKNVKIQGVAEHYEGGPVGGAWTKPLLRWKLQLLKDMGVNAVRLGHNPYPPMFYELADELGIMLMDEIFDGWKQKARHDYGAHHFDKWWKTDLEEWVTRNRNHPSIIIYSVGNETHGKIAPELVKAVKEFDPTRLVTSGSTNKEGMDVVGINGGSEGKSFFKRRFDRPFVSTEAPHTWQTRGYYRTQTWWRDGPKSNTFDLPSITEKEIFFYDWKDPKDWVNQKQHLNSSYDNATVRINARKNWEMARDLPHHSGHFRWTGFDYHGEAGLAHGGWPFIAFMGGALDLAGFKKDLFHLYRSQWLDEPSLHILPSWTHPTMKKGTKIPVWVYSNLDEVELFLNGKSLGKDKPGLKAEDMQCEWFVPWQPGTLTAVGYKNGKKVLEQTLNTAGAPVALRHQVEVFEAESDFDTAKVISTETVDKNQEFYPYGAHKVYYHFTDGVKVKALENGSPFEHTNRVRANFRPLFMGKNRAFVEVKYPQAMEYATIGAIVGDEALRLSNEVSIDAQYLPLTDSARYQMQQMQIVYSINDAYATDMQTYNKPFTVKNGDTVYAKVLVNGKVILNMQQSFGDGVGIFWGDENSANMWVGRGLSMQGEAAEYKGDAAAVRDAHGVHGGAYGTFNDKEGSMYWYHENDGEEGVYKAVFRYTHNDQKTKRRIAIYINNEKATEVEFEPTGSWDSKWSEQAFAKFTLVKGANHIEFRTMGESGPNIDQFVLE
ncbi:glycoside hydrolase family 2 TIM barrel-domain containing protein [Catenovulum maritimum]|uniref:Beta-galactosidase n=1 Tax=Catenovulum maritimum TaxID=1513271 RepID=A0A0J8H0S3_9ALTE|nr:glycoside hydrolase family 2 TIM barrel-domain containing protein [Catenovulum maritimum]KMT67049.1 beta-galactosidase [Catenovulum maritimum]